MATKINSASAFGYYLPGSKPKRIAANACFFCHPGWPVRVVIIRESDCRNPVKAANNGK